MNKKGNMLLQVGLFLVLWLVSGVVWSFWLDGIAVPIAGVLTAVAAIFGINVTLNWGGR